MKFRIEYYDFKDKNMKTDYLEALDSNEAKSLWNSKNSKKGKLSSLCEINAYNQMSQKYGHLMRH